MSTHTETRYTCDKCKKKLPGRSEVEIVAEVTDGNPWQRLHLVIENHHGMHNDGTSEKADLCKACAISLIESALTSLKKGERVTAGVRSVDAEHF